MLQLGGGSYCTTTQTVRPYLVIIASNERFTENTLHNDVTRMHLLLTAYVVRWEGNVLTRVCPSIHPSVCPHLGGTQARSR